MEIKEIERRINDRNKDYICKYFEAGKADEGFVSYIDDDSKIEIPEEISGEINKDASGTFNNKNYFLYFKEKSKIRKQVEYDPLGTIKWIIGSIIIPITAIIISIAAIVVTVIIKIY